MLVFIFEVELKVGVQMFKIFVCKYIKDIFEKYIIEGEIVDGVLMFLFFEVIYVELYFKFLDFVCEGFDGCVWIVLLIICMVILNIMCVILKDVWMCEQVGEICKVLKNLYCDVEIVGECVGKLEIYLW